MGTTTTTTTTTTGDPYGVRAARARSRADRDAAILATATAEHAPECGPDGAGSVCMLEHEHGGHCDLYDAPELDNLPTDGTGLRIVGDWFTTDTEPQPNGTPGSDGAGLQYNIRWTHRSRHAAINVDTYTVDLAAREQGADPCNWHGDHEEDGGYIVGPHTEPAPRWIIETVTEFITYTDPEDIGGTESWSDYTYYEPDRGSYTSEAEAEHAATVEAASYLDPRIFARSYTWDGTPGNATTLL